MIGKEIILRKEDRFKLLTYYDWILFNSPFLHIKLNIYIYKK